MLIITFFQISSSLIHRQVKILFSLDFLKVLLIFFVASWLVGPFKRSLARSFRDRARHHSYELSFTRGFANARYNLNKVDLEQVYVFPSQAG